jgi:drug/metabolite transporter (DMT)-like permease
MVVAALFFGLSNNLAKVSYGFGVGAMTVITGRAWFGLIALLVLSKTRGHKLSLPRAALWLFGLTALANMVQNPAILYAIKFIPISLAILIIYLFPIIVALFTAILGHDRVTRPVAIAALVGFAGVALVLELGTIALDWRGMVLAFVGACALSTNVMGAARLSRHMPALVVPLWLYGVSVPVFTAILFAEGGPQLPTAHLGWLAFLGAISVLPIALACFYSALPRAGAARAALVMNFEPLFTVLLAVLLLGETLGPMQIAGGVLIIGSIFYVSIYGRR